MAPVQSKLVAHGKQYQSTLIPVVASTPHGPANFMSLGRIVVDHTVHHDTSQHFHLTLTLTLKDFLVNHLKSGVKIR